MFSCVKSIGKEEGQATAGNVEALRVRWRHAKSGKTRLEASAGCGFGAEFLLFLAQAGLHDRVGWHNRLGLYELALVSDKQMHQEFDAILLFFDLLLQEDNFGGLAGQILGGGGIGNVL